MNPHFINRLFVLDVAYLKCMPTSKKIAKLVVSIGIKGILCIICLASVGAALVTYTSTVTVNPKLQLTSGATTASWFIYVNEQNQMRYLPGGFNEVTLATSDPTTYCFKVVTDSNKVCAVKVELTSTINASKFSKFQITMRSSTGDTWGDEPLYSDALGTNTVSNIDGLTPGSAAYVHQATSATKYYEIKVTYSYDLVGEDGQVPVTVQLTPLPRDSFT